MNGISRRQFAVTPTAAATAAALAPTAARTRPAPLTDRDFYFVHSDPSGVLHTIALPGRTNPHKPRPVVNRRRFTPLAASERFRVVVVDWAWHDDLPDGFYQADSAAQAAFWDLQSANRPTLLPVSLLDLPRTGGQTAEHVHGECPFVTRAHGIASVARLNREAYQAGEEPGEWHVLVEYGEPEPDASLLSIHIGCTGVGIDTGHVSSPVRLVIPTEEERSRYMIR